MSIAIEMSRPCTLQKEKTKVYAYLQVAEAAESCGEVIGWPHAVVLSALCLSGAWVLGKMFSD